MSFFCKSKKIKINSFFEKKYNTYINTSYGDNILKNKYSSADVCLINFPELSLCNTNEDIAQHNVV